jgi:hypothetical protein
MTGEAGATELTRYGRGRGRKAWTGMRIDGLTEDELAAAWVAGYERGGDGWFIGRDPREMTQAQLEAMGHEPISPMQAIRAKCLDCCAWSSDEVRKCVALACPSWPFRTGKNPWRQEMSEEQRKARRQRALQSGLGSRRQARSASSAAASVSEVRDDRLQHRP